MTEEQLANIKQQMALENYRSFSRFIRDSALKTRRPDCEIGDVDDTICRQIHALSVQINKIGNNYNQVVKNYNTALKFKNPNGSTVIDEERTKYYLNRLHSQTVKLVTCLRQIRGLIEKSQKH